MSGSVSVMVPRQILSRVFHIREAMEGTGFSIEVNGSQYIVTAKHIVANLVIGGSVGFEDETGWLETEVTSVWHHPDPTVDVAVFTLPDAIGILGAVELGGTLPVVGEPVYLAGFPYGMTTVGPEGPLPLVKHGILSGFEPKSDLPYRMMIFDAISNPGFSGGPIVFQRGADWAIAAIATSGMAESREIQALEHGEGAPSTAPFVHVYAGFMFGVPIRYAEDGVAKLGFGPPAVSG